MGAEQVTRAPAFPPPLLPALVSEFVGTALLLATVVGSGVMADQLCGGNVGLALLCNALATGGALVALISTFGGFSGAHFNPVVSAVAAARRDLPTARLAPYIAVQQAGALCGVALAHAMFALPLVQTSSHLRSTSAEVVSEVVATFGLVLVILGTVRNARANVAFAVAGYIVAAYWFTASTSFANPAVTVARSFSDTFAGIAPVSVAGFVAAQAVGAALAAALFWVLERGRRSTD